MRGEYKFPKSRMTPLLGSPPLARGVHKLSKYIRKLVRITPACAGSTVSIAPRKLPRQDHPRLRGEYNLQLMVESIRLGSPPLARGVPICRSDSQITFRITPACAGSTPVACAKCSISEDHPRLRGEYFICLHGGFRFIGSPPLARGVRCDNDSTQL